MLVAVCVKIATQILMGKIQSNGSGNVSFIWVSYSGAVPGVTV